MKNRAEDINSKKGFPIKKEKGKALPKSMEYIGLVESGPNGDLVEITGGSGRIRGTSSVPGRTWRRRWRQWMIRVSQ
jgi:hypothetical protein